MEGHTWSLSSYLGKWVQIPVLLWGHVPFSKVLWRVRVGWLENGRKTIEIIFTVLSDGSRSRIQSSQITEREGLTVLQITPAIVHLSPHTNCPCCWLLIQWHTQMYIYIYIYYIAILETKPLTSSAKKLNTKEGYQYYSKCRNTADMIKQSIKPYHFGENHLTHSESLGLCRWRSPRSDKAHCWWAWHGLTGVRITQS